MRENMQEELRQVYQVLGELLLSKPFKTLLVHENDRVCLSSMHKLASFTKNEVLLLRFANKVQYVAPQSDVTNSQVCFSTSYHNNKHLFE